MIAQAESHFTNNDFCQNRFDIFFCNVVSHRWTRPFSCNVIELGTIPILRQHIFGLFLTQPHSHSLICTLRSDLKSTQIFMGCTQIFIGCKQIFIMCTLIFLGVPPRPVRKTVFTKFLEYDISSKTSHAWQGCHGRF